MLPKRRVRAGLRFEQTGKSRKVRLGILSVQPWQNHRL
jgi:hypothetical protein